MVDVKKLFNLSDCCEHRIPEEALTIEDELLDKLIWNRVTGIAADNICCTENYILTEKGQIKLKEAKQDF